MRSSYLPGLSECSGLSPEGGGVGVEGQAQRHCRLARAGWQLTLTGFWWGSMESVENPPLPGLALVLALVWMRGCEPDSQEASCTEGQGRTRCPLGHGQPVLEWGIAHALCTFSNTGQEAMVRGPDRSRDCLHKSVPFGWWWQQPETWWAGCTRCWQSLAPTSQRPSLSRLSAVVGDTQRHSWRSPEVQKQTRFLVATLLLIHASSQYLPPPQGHLPCHPYLEQQSPGISI